MNLAQTVLGLNRVVARSVGKVVRHRGLTRRVIGLFREARVVDPVFMDGVRFLMELWPQDPIDFMLHYDGCYERAEGELFCELVRPGQTVLDVGAHAGYYTLAAARSVGESGRVHAFEPSETNFARLRRNVELNGLTNVALNKVAMSDREGEAAMYLSAEDPGQHSLGRVGEVSAECVVPTVTLDGYVAKSGLARLDMVKIDVEGAETMVLRGGREVLARDRPSLLIEINEVRLRSLASSGSELLGVLRELGYEVEVIVGGARRPPEGKIREFCNAYAFPAGRNQGAPSGK